LSDQQIEELRENPFGTKALEVATQFGREELTADLLWRQLETLRKDEQDRLKAADTELQEKRRELERARLALEQRVDKKLTQLAQQESWRPFQEELLAIFGSALREKLENSGAKTDGVPTVDELAKVLPKTKQLLQGISAGGVAFLAFALVSVAAPFLLQLEGVDRVLSLIVAGASGLSSVVATVKGAAEWLEKKIEAYDARMQSARTRISEQRDRMLRAEREQPLKEGGKATIGDLESELRALEAKVEAHRRTVGITARHESLVDFIKGRLDTGFYEERLGLIHQVQKDLEELTGALVATPTDSDTHRQAKEKLFPRGSPRVVLIVDDLDRCPPRRVVEVLEATQLLVRTKLFVVVLGMDVRYVTRALEKAYRHVLCRDGDPSGLDYIEKIVQIPYRVRPVQREAWDDYLRYQMQPRADKRAEPEARQGAAEPPTGETPAWQPPGSAGAPGKPPPSPPPKRGPIAAEPEERLPPEVLEFSERELTLLRTCCEAVQVSPRAAKRLVNVFKLLKIIWHRRGLGSGPGTDINQSIMLLLALSSRYPEIMRAVLQDLEQEFRVGPHRTKKLSTFLKDHCNARIGGAYREAEWEQLLAIAEDEAAVPGVALSAMSNEDVCLARSFSFVGELDEEQESLIRETASKQQVSPAPDPANAV
jgi:hypothetical protein